MSGEAQPILTDLAKALGGSLHVEGMVYPPSNAVIPSYVAVLPTQEAQSDFVARVSAKRVRAITDIFIGSTNVGFRVWMWQAETDRLAPAFFNSELGTPGAIRYQTVPGELPANQGPGNN